MQHNILIVDDNGDLRKLLRLTLASSHYRLHEATDGLQALAMANAVRPQLVLLDVMMPGAVDGYEVCRRIKSDAALRGTRVMLITARGQQQDLLTAREAGADRFLVKPFSPIALIEQAEQLLAEIPRHPHTQRSTT